MGGRGKKGKMEGKTAGGGAERRASVSKNEAEMTKKERKKRKVSRRWTYCYKRVLEGRQV